MDCSSPGSSVHRPFQARMLEWVAISFSRGSSQPKDRTSGLLHCRQILYQLSYKGSLCIRISPSYRTSLRGLSHLSRSSQSIKLSSLCCSAGSNGPSVSHMVHSSDNTAAAAAAKSLQSCPTLCNPIDCSPPGSPVPGILQARTLEWTAISFSK